MPDVVIIGDTFRSPELRHEVPVGVPDEFLYVEAGGRRHVVLRAIELPVVDRQRRLRAARVRGVRRRRAAAHEPLPPGADRRDRAARAAGSSASSEAVVPGGFPLLTADKLRAAGIELTPDRELFVERRRAEERPPSSRASAGRRPAAEAGMAAARDLLRQARAGRRTASCTSRGARSTVAEVKAAIASAFIAHGASADVFVVSHGPQSAIGHHLGDGHLRAGETIIDRPLAAGQQVVLLRRHDPDVRRRRRRRTRSREWHRLCVEALERAVERARPGRSAATLRRASATSSRGTGSGPCGRRPEGETLEEGFFHSLGHGVGLEVHEAPSLGLLGSAPLVAGDVLALEPGLYRPGLGGVRVEDLVLVGEDGPEVLDELPVRPPRAVAVALVEDVREPVLVLERPDHGEVELLVRDQVLRDALDVLGGDGVDLLEQLLGLEHARPRAPRG